MQIEVVQIKDNKVIHSVKCNEHNADKVERGILINMDRDRFFTRQIKD